MVEKSAIERALELSVDGRHRTLAEIRVTLHREGYENAHAHMSGQSFRKRLQERLKATWSERTVAQEP